MFSVPLPQFNRVLVYGPAHLGKARRAYSSLCFVKGKAGIVPGKIAESQKAFCLFQLTVDQLFVSEGVHEARQHFTCAVSI